VSPTQADAKCNRPFMSRPLLHHRSATLETKRYRCRGSPSRRRSRETEPQSGRRAEATMVLAPGWARAERRTIQVQPLWRSRGPGDPGLVAPDKHPVRHRRAVPREAERRREVDATLYVEGSITSTVLLSESEWHLRGARGRRLDAPMPARDREHRHSSLKVSWRALV
jgi:hypothetical protein